jgi:acetaldehyde dehydrogenase
MTRAKIRVAIIGTGNIGADLAERLLLEDEFELVALTGRRADSPGLIRMEGRIPHLLSDGIDGLAQIIDEVDGVFDATSAFDHRAHWDLLSAAGKWAIDLTPSKIGTPMVPVLIGKAESMRLIPDKVANYSMITCGGQSSAALVYSMAANSTRVDRVEVSSSIASRSAGPATRRNIDNYVVTTESFLSLVSGCGDTKAIIVLNPTDPPVMMRTTVTLKADECDIEATQATLHGLVDNVKAYVPGYDLVVDAHVDPAGNISATAKVTGAGYYLPTYSGNLDIINAAAVETARAHARQFKG